MRGQRSDTLARVSVLPPGIRTFKPRRGRVTSRQAEGLRDGADFLVELGDSDPTALLGEYDRVFLDIGFGMGDTVEPFALAQPDIGILAIDIHTPGIGDLLHRCAHTPLPNVRVMSADALEVLPLIAPASLAGVRSYFPDPWPKARHHKRRLVQQPVLDLVASRVRPNSSWHLATDWAEYAEVMIQEFAANPHWTGGVIDRPEWRPMTRFERTGLEQGRASVDLWFTRVDA